MRAVPQTFVLLTYHTFGLTARSPIAEEMQEMETVSALRIDWLLITDLSIRDDGPRVNTCIDRM